MSFNNKDIVILASAARTTEQLIENTNQKGRGIHLTIDVTLDPAAASITPSIEGKDPASGKFYTILAGAAIADTGIVTLKVFPGAPVVADLSENDILPATWRFKMAVADTASMTYSVGASVIL